MDMGDIKREIPTIMKDLSKLRFESSWIQGDYSLKV